MEYLLLIYQAEEIWEHMADEERQAVLARHMRLHDYMAEHDVEWTGRPLLPTSAAVSVLGSGTEQTVRDGPFAETKEQLAGFYLVNVPDFAMALELAKRLQEFEPGTVELRPVADHSEHAPQ